jgi:hypothetical protein
MSQIAAATAAFEGRVAFSGEEAPSRGLESGSVVVHQDHVAVNDRAVSAVDLAQAAAQRLGLRAEFLDGRSEKMPESGEAALDQGKTSPGTRSHGSCGWKTLCSGHPAASWTTAGAQGVTKQRDPDHRVMSG